MDDIPRPVAAIIQTRVTSTRLPGKVLKPLAGAPLIRRLVERVRRIAGVDVIAVALAEGKANDPVLPALDGIDAVVVRGSEADVLARTAAAARATQAATVMRITSDCPLVDPDVSACVLAAYAAGAAAGIRYARTSASEGFPHGFDTEVFEAQALYEAEDEATEPYDREHATPFIRDREERYPGVELVASPDRRSWRLTVDTEEDYRLVEEVYDRLYPHNPAFGYAELCSLFEDRPDLLQINAHVTQPAHAGRR